MSPRFKVRGQCVASGCAEQARVWDYCMSHYRRWKKHGDPLGRQASPNEPMDFLLKIAAHDGEACIRWPFSKADWYHSIALGGGRFSKAHREMCRIAHGSPPSPAHQAMHSCDNKWCVNPKHLSWGTPQENISDAVSRGRTLRGEKVPAAKLTAQDVLHIRERHGRGQSLAQIAASYPSITRGNIWAIAHRKTWKHVA